MPRIWLSGGGKGETNYYAGRTLVRVIAVRNDEPPDFIRSPQRIGGTAAYVRSCDVLPIEIFLDKHKNDTR
jgi:hypothetical protein